MSQNIAGAAPPIAPWRQPDLNEKQRTAIVDKIVGLIVSQPQDPKYLNLLIEMADQPSQDGAIITSNQRILQTILEVPSTPDELMLRILKAEYFFPHLIPLARSIWQRNDLSNETWSLLLWFQMHTSHSGARISPPPVALAPNCSSEAIRQCWSAMTNQHATAPEGSYWRMYAQAFSFWNDVISRRMGDQFQGGKGIYDGTNMLYDLLDSQIVAGAILRLDDPDILVKIADPQSSGQLWGHVSPYDPDVILPAVAMNRLTPQASICGIYHHGTRAIRMRVAKYGHLTKETMRFINSSIEEMAASGDEQLSAQADAYRKALMANNCLRASIGVS